MESRPIGRKFWAQWAIIRRQVEQAGWWVATQTLGWLVLFGVAKLTGYGAAAVLGGRVEDYLPVSYVLGGAAFGAITAAVLVRMFRKPAGVRKLTADG